MHTLSYLAYKVILRSENSQFYSTALANLLKNPTRIGFKIFLKYIFKRLIFRYLFLKYLDLCIYIYNSKNRWHQTEICLQVSNLKTMGLTSGSQCGPENGSFSKPWELFRNAGSWVSHLEPLTQTLGAGPAVCCNKPFRWFRCTLKSEQHWDVTEMSQVSSN